MPKPVFVLTRITEDFDPVMSVHTTVKGALVQAKLQWAGICEELYVTGVWHKNTDDNREMYIRDEEEDDIVAVVTECIPKTERELRAAYKKYKETHP